MRRRIRATFRLRCLLLAVGLVPSAVAMRLHAPFPVVLAAFASAEVGALILELALVRAMSQAADHPGT